MKSDPKVIGLDFDETFTAMPEVFAALARQAMSLGHRVYIVTARHDTYRNNEEVDSFLQEYGCDDIPVFYTGLKSKIDFMQGRGINVNIWIDDNPHAVVHGH